MKKLFYFSFVSFLFFSGAFLSVSAQSDSINANGDDVFLFDHSLPRMFSIPTGRVLNSLDFSLLLGSSLSFGRTNNYLGTVALGLGGYGDIELSSASLMGSIFNSEESFSYIGMKIKLLSENERLPELAIGIKTNNEWNNSNRGSQDILSNSSDLFNTGLRGINYDARMTSAYLSATKKIRDIVSVHAGLSFSDLRLKNINTIYNYWNAVYNHPEEEIKNIFNFFGGLEFDLNERTKLLLEVQSFPYVNVNVRNGHLETEKRVLGIVGLRFFISRWLLVDSGVLYQDNYKGLADAQLKVSLNGIWNLRFK